MEGGGAPVAKTYPEAASQTFKKGEAVYLDGSGNVAEFTASVDTGSVRFLGFAAEDAHNDSVAANSSVSVDIPVPGTVVELNVTSNGSDQVTAKTQIGTRYPMYQDTTNSIIMVDIADTGGQIDCFIVKEIVGTVGDTNGRVRCTVDPVALQVGGTKVTIS
jgi:hypothetical protein